MSNAAIPPEDPKPIQSERNNPPSPNEVERLEGKTTIDDKLTFEVDALSHRALRNVLKQLGDRLKQNFEKDGGTYRNVFLLTPVLTLAFETKRAYEAQLALLQTAFQNVCTLAHGSMNSVSDQKASREVRAETVGPVSLMSGDVLKTLSAVVTMLAVFRQDSDYFGRPVEISETAIAALVGGEVRRAGVSEPEAKASSALSVPDREFCLRGGPAKLATEHLTLQRYPHRSVFPHQKKKGIIYKSPETQALTTVPGLFDPPGFDGTEDCPRQLGHSI